MNFTNHLAELQDEHLARLIDDEEGVRDENDQHRRGDADRDQDEAVHRAGLATVAGGAGGAGTGAGGCGRAWLRPGSGR